MIDALKKTQNEKIKLVFKDILELNNYKKEKEERPKNIFKKLTNSQKEFVLLFLDNENNVLTERKVAEKLGISQQAISKKIKKIKKFLKKWL